MQTNKYSAVTFIEVALLLGIFAVLSTAFLPFALSQISQSRVEEQAKNIKSYLDYYQKRSLVSENNSTYGASFSASAVTYFAGTSLATATDTYVIDLGDGVFVGDISMSNSATELTFIEGTLEPSEFGSITVTDGETSYEISINREGYIEVRKL